MKKIVIFGATSAIAAATAREYAQDGSEFVLVGRSQEKLDIVKQDIVARGARKVETVLADLSVSEEHKNLFQKILELLPELDTALVAYGSLGEQHAAEEDFSVATKEFDTNFTSVVSLLTELANYFSTKKDGTIAVISSVAGDRGRQSNYVYGAAKGALSILLQGLRNRLYSENVHVLTIKPGFVDTPMTEGVKKNFLFAKPEYVAEVIKKAIENKKDVVYVPWFWRYIMLIIKLIPEFIFKRLSL